MTMIGLCDCYNDPTRVSMIEPITRFMDKKKQEINDDMPLLTMIDAYDPEGNIIRVIIFNLIEDDLPYLNSAEKRFLVDGVRQKYVAPVFGIVKDKNDLYCAMVLYYHEMQVQVITPALKELFEALLKAQMNDEPCYVCTRVSLDKNEGADITEIYRLKLRRKKDQFEQALNVASVCSDDEFYKRGCSLSDQLTDSNFMIIHGEKKKSVLN